MKSKSLLAAVLLYVGMNSLPPELGAQTRRSSAASGPIRDPSTGAINWSRVKAIIRAGDLIDRTNSNPQLVQALRNSVEHAIGGLTQTVFVAGELPADAQAAVRRGAIREFSVDVAITRMDRVQAGDQVRVTAEVNLALISEPAHDLVASMSGRASGAGGVMSADSEASIQGIQEAVLNGAVRGALGPEFETSLLGNPRRRTRRR